MRSLAISWGHFRLAALTHYSGPVDKREDEGLQVFLNIYRCSVISEALAAFTAAAYRVNNEEL